MAAVAREGVLATRFFQAAFGGSFLSHQWLIAGRAPEWNSTAKPIPDGMQSIVDMTVVFVWRFCLSVGNKGGSGRFMCRVMC